jgi:hypothetical protein
MRYPSAQTCALRYLGWPRSSTQDRKDCSCSALHCNRAPEGYRTWRGDVVDSHHITQLVREHHDAIDELLGFPPWVYKGKVHWPPDMELSWYAGGAPAGNPLLGPFLMAAEERQCGLGPRCYLTRAEAEAWVHNSQCHIHRFGPGEVPCNAFGTTGCSGNLPHDWPS